MNKIIKHALGLDWSNKPYRNKYVASFNTEKFKECEYLVSLGLMESGEELTYGQYFYVIEENLKKKPVLDMRNMMNGHTGGLCDHIKYGANQSVGLNYGISNRETYNLDLLDEGYLVRVVFPLELEYMSTNFFEGLFGPSIRKLGDDFYSQYKFSVAKGSKIILNIHKCVETVRGN